MVKTKCFAKMKNGLLAKLFGAAVLSVGLLALVGTKALAANEVEDNNSLSAAMQIGLNDAVTGNLSSAGDIDWYKFTLTEPGSMSVSFENEATYGNAWNMHVYGDDEQRYHEGYYGGDAKKATTVAKTVPAGTYYIKVQNKDHDYYSNANYTLTVNYESSVGKDMEQESNDSITTANNVELGKAYKGQLRLSSDIDWYKFTLTEPGSISVSFENEATYGNTWKMYVYGDDEQRIVYHDGTYGGDAKKRTTTDWIVPAGTYYIKVQNKDHDYYSNANYTLTVNYESSVGKDMEQESNDTPSTANLISVNKNYSGRVSLEKDLDWYAFDLEESSTVTVTLSHDVIDSSSWYWNVRVYDNAEMTNKLLDCHWQGNKEKQTSETEIKVGAGRYYVLIDKSYYWSTGNYTFCVNATPAGKKTMLRLYNPNSGEHFYTASEREKNALVAQGWSFEGKAWDAPEFSNTPVYRLYNKNSGDHHYTPSKKERDNLVKQGWKDEGIGWYSDDSKTTPLYRLYNPNAVAGSHHYTTSTRERDNLVKQGWKDENIGWYGL